MIDLETLHGIYTEYDEIALKVRQNATPFAGLLGLGNDPRKDRCHTEFYEKLKAWVEDFCSREPSSEEVFEVAQEIILAADRRRNTETYFFNFAAHGLVIPLISLMTAEQCRTLAQLYDEKFPKRERMPVHKNLYKQLVKAGK